MQNLEEKLAGAGGRDGRFWRLRAGILPALVVLAGCASVPGDLGRGEVSALAVQRGQPELLPGDEQALARLLGELSAAELDADTAIRIALINNPDLRADYASLGFAAADIYDAGRIANPAFSVAVLDTNAAGERDQSTFGLVLPFTDLLTMRVRKRLAAGEFAALQQAIAARVVALAAEVEIAFEDYRTALQLAEVSERSAQSARLVASLADQFLKAGNISRREWAEIKARASSMRITALNAQGEATHARAALANLLGLSSAGDWRPSLNPSALPARDPDPAEMIALAQSRRLDLVAARTRLATAGENSKATRWLRWLGDVDLGYEYEKDTDGAELSGPSLDLELPIFSQHRDDLLRAETDAELARLHVGQLKLGIANEVRLYSAALRNARARAEEYRDVLLPMREMVVARSQEEVNFMLTGIFELMELRQDQYEAAHGYLESLHAYRVARARLAQAVGDRLPGEGEGERMDFDTLLGPSGGGAHQHSSGTPMTGGSGHEGHQMPMPGEPVEQQGKGMDGHEGHDAMQSKPAVPASKPSRQQPDSGDMHEGHQMNGKPVEQKPNSNDGHQGHEGHSGHQEQSNVPAEIVGGGVA